MDHRFLVVAVLGLGCAGAAALACSGPDPGSITFAERRAGFESTPGGSSNSSTSGGADGGATPDAGGSSSGTTNDPIFGTTPFAYQNPGQNANGANAAHQGTVEGKDCYMSGCHGPTGAVGPQWLIGGTVYADATGNTTIAQAEVKVVDGTGKEIAKAYTDANGNFWMDKGAATLPAGSKVGVRTATKSKAMATTLAAGQGNCNNATGCHTKGTMQIYVN